MPENAQIIFEPQTIPEGICPQDEQERFNLYTAHLSGYLPGDYTTFSVGTSTPSVDDQDKPWLRLNADGTYDRLYTFSNGAWTAPHPIPASSKIRMLWMGTPTELETFDGGAAGAVTSLTGPMWEVDTDFDDKIPRGASATVPVNTNDAQLSSGASAADEVRGAYFIKRTGRSYFTV